MLDFDFSKISHEDLARMESAIQKEKEKRKTARYAELVVQLCGAYNALKAEFPYTELMFESECPDCDVHLEFNVFDQFENLAPNMFARG